MARNFERICSTCSPPPGHSSSAHAVPRPAVAALPDVAPTAAHEAAAPPHAAAAHVRPAMAHLALDSALGGEATAASGRRDAHVASQGSARLVERSSGDWGVAGETAAAAAAFCEVPPQRRPSASGDPTPPRPRCDRLVQGVVSDAAQPRRAPGEFAKAGKFSLPWATATAAAADAAVEDGKGSTRGSQPSKLLSKLPTSAASSQHRGANRADPGVCCDGAASAASAEAMAIAPPGRHA
mmetsp:Transcript_163590/g.519779  ORF Transcript_163590/g.519779 Transcript_163590/m.519779 type:complete len:239 (+) Transcript_163590:2394-3110(+)